jgi:elongation factor Ts
MSKKITPDMIKELRERTGVGMGKCKEALEQAKGDMELAIENLRKAGMATAVKKEGRTTNEGLIAVAESPKVIALVEVNAETDFVVRNDRFQEFLKQLAQEAAATNPSSLESFKEQKYSKDKGMTIESYRASLVQAIGENIQIRRVKTFAKEPNKSIGVYSHLGGKVVTVVEIAGSNSEAPFAKEIAMHVAAASPEYLSEKEVPQAIISQEKEIAKSQIQGKPENIVNKILEGKVSSFFDAVCLTRQKYIKDDSVTITDLVNKHAKTAGKPLTITNFIRWTVGQG